MSNTSAALLIASLCESPCEWMLSTATGWLARAHFSFLLCFRVVWLCALNQRALYLWFNSSYFESKLYFDLSKSTEHHRQWMTAPFQFFSTLIIAYFAQIERTLTQYTTDIENRIHYWFMRHLTTTIEQKYSTKHFNTSKFDIYMLFLVKLMLVRHLLLVQMVAFTWKDRKFSIWTIAVLFKCWIIWWDT